MAKDLVIAFIFCGGDDKNCLDCEGSSKLVFVPIKK